MNVTFDNVGGLDNREILPPPRLCRRADGQISIN
jgi:hypothetical protein